MSQSFLIFDFGTNEEAAQQARHKIEGWKQGFRLGNKIQLKFERHAGQGDGAQEKEKAAAADAAGTVSIRVFVRLDFSDHEKLSHHRWLERIAAETPFKEAKSRVLRAGDPAFSEQSAVFDSLD